VGGPFHVIPRTVTNETFHTNPKRKRGNNLKTSLTLRVSVAGGREWYKLGGPFHAFQPQP
jgi:hypothetical protein